MKWYKKSMNKTALARSEGNLINLQIIPLLLPKILYGYLRTYIYDIDLIVPALKGED
jgi:hypothetical protein